MSVRIQWENAGECEWERELWDIAFFYRSVDIRIDMGIDTHRQWLNVLRFD